MNKCTTHPQGAPAAPGMPLAADLREVLVQVLEDFAYIAAQAQAEPAEELPLCYSSLLPDGQGWLVLRGSRELGRVLAEASTGSSGEGLDEDAFIELCNISASHLARRICSDHKGPWSSFVPEPGLPQGLVLASVTLEAGGQPLEASVWMAP